MNLDEDDTCASDQRAPKRRKTSHADAPVALRHDSYTVAWICALHIEMAAAQIMLDEGHDALSTHPGDHNTYKLGRIKEHNVVIVCLPAHHYGIGNAANVVTNLTRTFPAIQTGLMVGIGGGVPSTANDIRLGDIVVGSRVVQCDLGKVVGDGQLQRTAFSRFPHQRLGTAVSALRSKHELGPSQIPFILQQKLESHPTYHHPNLPDRLFYPSHNHESTNQDCSQCDQSKLILRSERVSKNTMIHYGPIASGNQVMKSGTTRDAVAQQLEVICFEMEAAGLMDTLSCLTIRGICDYSDSHKNKEWQRYAAAVAAAYARELLEELPKNEGNSKLSPEINAAKELSSDHRQHLLESLKFDQISSRKLNIKAAHAKTCRWFLRHPSYQEWLDPSRLAHHHGFLWISGKPGAGKSTIMKFAYMDMKRKAPSHYQHALVASFFFNARGEYLEKSVLGMYRSLLFQLLQGYPALQSVLDDTDVILHGCTSLNVLKDLFSNAVLSLGERSFICYVDALDECDEQQTVEMVQYFEDLAEQCASEGLPFRVCFSSRHYPYIIIKQGIRLTLEDQKGHSQDLETYIASRLQVKDSALSEDLRAELLEKSAGVFMWVVLVVDILNTEYRGSGFSIRKRLKEIPSDLSELFKKILRRDNENLEELQLCIVWILYANRPLQPKEFYHALWSGLALKGLVDDRPPIFSDPDSSDSLIRFTRCVISSSKGLAEVTKSNVPTIQFIHESVRDFLVKDKGLYQMWPELGPDWESSSHEMLKKSCNLYLDHVYAFLLTNMPTKEWRSVGLSKSSRSEVMNPYPFSKYACQQVLYHSEASAASNNQYEYLARFQNRLWTTLHNLFEDFQVREYGDTASLGYILAEKGYPILIRNWTEHNPQIHDICQSERYRYPLFAAIASGNRESVAAVLNIPSSIHNGVDIMEGVDCGKDHKKYKGQDPLLWAVKEGRSSIVKTLLLQGMDPSETKYKQETPLSIAITHGHEELAIQILLHSKMTVKDQKAFFIACKQGSRRLVILMLEKLQGAELDSRDNSGRTPLFLAAESGSEAIVRLLVERGAEINSRSYFGYTPLLLAAKSGSEAEAIVRFLVESGAEIDPRDHDEHTPILRAVRCGSEAIVRFLVEKGANIESRDNYGYTPLSWAVTRGVEAIVRLLVERGAEINTRNNRGYTPLSLAVREGFEAIVRLLVERGAEINTRDNRGYTPLSLAVHEGFEAIVRLLVARGGEK